MSLKFVIGPSGSGKSTYIFKRMIEDAATNKGREFLVLVPEQFTLQTQSRLVTLSPDGGILNVDVVSFDRLAYRVFDELGTKSYNVLGDTGKMLILRKIAAACGDELPILGPNLHKISYLDHIKSLISEFKQYRITPDDLGRMSKLPGAFDFFSAKMLELQKLYQAFEEFLSEKYITSEMILDLFCQVAGRSAIIKNSVIALDGYTGFTPVQLELLRIFMAMGCDITVSVCGDPDMEIGSDYDRHELFAMSHKMVKSLLRIAADCGCQVEEPLRLDGSMGRFAHNSTVFFHLENNLFRPLGTEYAGEDAAEHICLCKLPSPRRELEFVAERIREAVRTAGLSYKDIAVVCPDINEYEGSIEPVFKKAGIPVFIDKKSEVFFHPLTELLFGALDIVCFDFDQDGVMRLLRSGLSGLGREKTDMIERYLVSSGIRGRRQYGRAFTRIPYGYEAADVAEVNEVFLSIRERLVAFYDAMKSDKCSVLDRLKECYNLFSYFDAQKALIQKASTFEQAGMDRMADSYRRLYPVLMDLMDQMADLLGDEDCSLRDFYDLLKSGIAESGMGHVPMSGDSVIFGDIERSRLRDIRLLFLIGAADGSIPYNSGRGGILSESERLLIEEGSFELAPGERERAFMQRFYLYLLLTKPMDRLVITYPSTSSSGDAQGASYLLGVIQKLFPACRISDIKDDDDRYWTETEGESYKLFLALMRSYAAGITTEDDEKKLFSLCTYFRESGHWDKVEEACKGVFFRYAYNPVSRAVMRAVSGDVMKLSVSRMEQYASCAYAYYLKYLLNLREQREHMLDQADMGTLYHSCLEIYAMELKRRGISWHDISDEESNVILEESIEKAISAYKDAELFDSAREAYVTENIKNTMRKSIWALTSHIRSGGYEPESFEVSLERIEDADSLRMHLEGLSDLQLTGVIDRIDTCEKDEKLYVKIIDYKSGGKDVDLGSLYFGLQIQLVVYMGAALEAEKRSHPDKEIVPGAFFYYHIQDPFVAGRVTDMGEDISETILKEMKVKGRFAEDREAVELLDKDAFVKGSYESPVIPLNVKKDGSYGSRTKSMTTGDIMCLIRYTKLLTKQMGEGILGGEFSATPFRTSDGRSSGCQYCSFHSVCGFDTGLPGYDNRLISGLTDDEVLTKIHERIAEDGSERVD